MAKYCVQNYAQRLSRAQNFRSCICFVKFLVLHFERRTKFCAVCFFRHWYSYYSSLVYREKISAIFFRAQLYGAEAGKEYVLGRHRLSCDIYAYIHEARQAHTQNVRKKKTKSNERRYKKK